MRAMLLNLRNGMRIQESLEVSKSVIKRARENFRKSNLKSEEVFMCLKRFFEEESL